ncbi:UDP-N-acetylmuramate-alanine ligase [Gemella sanguinis M325]|jgi:UDP-N-acetylmuramate--L-alanine ligase|uniref:UDP-N-acetylmuramate--L-alanine ligase n=1 Tax=Gemella sanguinis TaxID=84135 RepID=A0ABX6FLZ2_9BACL|nr:UDP-N-acetylmuramate--L-alanine ligase [Gemella sanguinis]EGF88342.1 UDP-N-acetylmuramate-alanine ligase [Gemella sanguinis M325]QGS07297.1 UDP-N-acetylmuramate--L-alanine ligase [Gemella sanguinis]
MSKYHFIGIKGSGMSSLAQIAYDMGHEVQGSDEETYFFTQEKLEQRNIPMYGYNAENIKEGFEVILGNAFDETHIEYRAAKDLGLKIYTYAQFLGKLLDEIPSIAVTGAHGKTTTSTMVSNIFKHNFVTSFLIGDGTGHGEKNSDYIVAEACEYYRHFLAYHPNYAIVTNIDFDHPDYFNDEHDMFDAFQSFVNQVKDTVVICGDDRLASQLKPSTAKVVTYGFNEGNDYQIKNVKTTSENSKFDVYKNSELLGTFTMAVFGLHDISNATSAIALADICGLSTDEIQQSLGSYHHAERRFTEHKVGTNIVVDDYAHHPSEIKATIDSARRKYSDKQIIAIFQPHTYTRTAKFLNEFAESLLTADKVFLCPIFASVREKEKIVGIEDLQKVTPGSEIIYGEENFDKLNFDNSVILFMGAGNINKLCNKFVEQNSNK